MKFLILLWVRVKVMLGEFILPDGKLDDSCFHIRIMETIYNRHKNKQWRTVRWTGWTANALNMGKRWSRIGYIKLVVLIHSTIRV